MPGSESDVREPLLPRGRGIRSGLFRMYRGLGILSGPTLSESTIVELLNCPDEKERDRLTLQWRDHKLEELNFVGIVVSRSTFRGDSVLGE
jgi:hypothetical protein